MWIPLSADFEGMGTKPLSLTALWLGVRAPTVRNVTLAYISISYTRLILTKKHLFGFLAPIYTKKWPCRYFPYRWSAILGDLTFTKIKQHYQPFHIFCRTLSYSAWAFTIWAGTGRAEQLSTLFHVLFFKLFLLPLPHSYQDLLINPLNVPNRLQPTF